MINNGDGTVTYSYDSSKALMCHDSFSFKVNDGELDSNVIEVYFDAFDGNAYWNSVFDKTIPVNSVDGTIVYDNLESFCHDSDETDYVTVDTFSPNFTLYFENGDLLIRDLESGFTVYDQTVSVSCNGVRTEFDLDIISRKRVSPVDVTVRMPVIMR